MGFSLKDGTFDVPKMQSGCSKTCFDWACIEVRYGTDSYSGKDSLINSIFLGIACTPFRKKIDYKFIPRRVQLST